MPFSIPNSLSITAQRYWTWTGRLSSTFFTFFFLGLGYSYTYFWFNILNTILGCSLVFMTSRFCFIATECHRPKHFRDGFISITLTFVALWWLSRTIGEVALWKTGSINYLWAICGEYGLLFFLYKNCFTGTASPTLAYLHKTLQGKALQWRNLPIFLGVSGIGCCVAMFLEPLALLFSLIYGGLTFLFWQNKNRRVLLAASIGHWAGSLTLFLAPGNFARKAHLPSSSITDRLDGLIGFAGSLFDLYWIGIAILGLIITIYCRKQHIHFTVSEIVKAHYGWIFLATCLIYLGSLLALPRSALASRVAFPASVLLISYFICMLYFILEKTRQKTNSDFLFPSVFSLCITAFFLAHIIFSTQHILSTFRLHEQATTVLSTSTHYPKTDAVILPDITIPPHHKRLMFRKDKIFMGFSPDPGHWINRCFANFYSYPAVRTQP